MPQSFAFTEGEKVLAYHGPLIHEASIKQMETKDAPSGGKLRLYLLRYAGYSAHWDEWVPESRILKHSAENVALQKDRIKDFQRAHKQKVKAESGGGSGAAGGGGAGGVAKKARIEGPSEEALSAELRESLRLPHGLKLKMIEDWERITRERKLVPLPRTGGATITELLDEFKSAKTRRTAHERLYGEVCDGLRSYFNQALPTLLLYA
jgi:mortality factor 4-like protein 1